MSEKPFATPMYARTGPKAFDVTFALGVAGHGVLLIRSASSYEDASGRLQPQGLSLLTAAEVGYSPKLVS